jgi:EAL domain-containing protein (putative c-di-GMP-specific phosphodiesterase class I)/CheY-like chemotaxis protein
MDSQSAESRGIEKALRAHDTQPIAAVTAEALARAIQQDELVLYYQPKADMRSGRVEGVEALVRWQHPELGLMPANSFIPLAEGFGVIRDLTLWSLNEALGQCSRWLEQGVGLSVAVNLSLDTLLDRKLPAQVARLLERWNLAPGWLQLEITETAVMHDWMAGMRTLTALSEMGVTLALDDFGTGYSSLQYLHRLPVKRLKIDKSFVMRMEADEGGMAILQAVVELARRLGLVVTAEGVETKRAWDRLRQIGCDEAQGYYISPEMPPQTLIEWLRRAEVGVVGRSRIRPRMKISESGDARRNGSAQATRPAIIRVLVAEDHMLVRQSLVKAVRTQPDFEVVAEAGRGDEALELAEKYRPDLFLLDINMPGGGGLQILPRLRQLVPTARVLFLTMREDEHSIAAAVGLGADGYVPKSASTEELVAALRKVAAGESYFSPSVARKLRGPGAGGRGTGPWALDSP